MSMHRRGWSLPIRLGSVAGRYCVPGRLWEWPAGDSPGRVNSLGEKGETSKGVSVRERVPGLARLEAVLFLADEPLTSRKIAQLADLADATQARTLIRLLNRLYDEESRSFRVEEVAGGFQLLSRPQFAPWLRRWAGAARELCLSSPALETLAVVAYRQPVLRAEIEAIRGVQCAEILRQLMDQDLIRIVGRSNELGRPFLYGTTKRFLQLFGLRHLQELPTMETCHSPGERQPAPPLETETQHQEVTAEESTGTLQPTEGYLYQKK